MGFIGSLLSGSKGMGYEATPAQLMDITNPGQLAEARQNTLGSTQQQQAFLNALSAQGGVGNQANVFAQQQGLAGLLGQQAMGRGPNPALAQLAQTTGQNMAGQAAMMAGQRGVGANPGLMARQIGQQGAALQQQAGGQAASMRAQQQLAAQQALQQQQAMMAGLAGQQVGQQQGALQQLGGMNLAQQQALLQAAGGQNAAAVQNQAGVNQANAGVQAATAKAQAGLLGGLMGGFGSAMGQAGGASGGGGGGAASLGAMAAGAEGGMVMPQSAFGKFFAGMGEEMKDDEDPLVKGFAQFGTGLGNQIKTTITPGPSIAPQVAAMHGGLGGYGSGMGMISNSGGRVPGQANVPGDSRANDTVPAILSPGEVVIPRSKVGDPQKTADFINAILGMSLSPKKGKK